MTNKPLSKIVKKKYDKLSPWCSLKTLIVDFSYEKKYQTYHAFSQKDYVSALVVTKDEMIPLVRQYRPSVEKYTIELPGGLINSGENPEETIIREIYEETGLNIIKKPNLLGKFDPDTGRLENKYWGFFINNVSSDPNKSIIDDGIETFYVSQKELFQMIIEGTFNHALHISLIGAALLKGYLKL